MLQQQKSAGPHTGPSAEEQTVPSVILTASIPQTPGTCNRKGGTIVQYAATVTDPDRAAEWQAIFGTNTLPIRSIEPQPYTAPQLDGSHLFYELDIDALTGRQRQQLIIALAAKFRIPEQIVAGELDIQGVPILAENCLVTTRRKA